MPKRVFSRMDKTNEKKIKPIHSALSLQSTKDTDSSRLSGFLLSSLRGSSMLPRVRFQDRPAGTDRKSLKSKLARLKTPGTRLQTCSRNNVSILSFRGLWGNVANNRSCHRLTASILTLILLFQTVAGVFMPVNIFKPSDKPLTANASWYSTGGTWSYRKAITIDYHKVAADLSSFPVLVSIVNDTDLGARAMANGYDIRFTDSTGAGAPLDYERENFAITNGNANANIWVKVPAVSHTANTVIYMYYGKADATDGENKTGVWNEGGSNNFKGIWHLNQDPSGAAQQMKDSTQYANDGTSMGSMVSGNLINGKIGKALSFDGSDDYIDLGDKAAWELTRYTYSVWFNPGNVSGGGTARIFNNYYGDEGFCWQHGQAEYVKSFHQHVGGGWPYAHISSAMNVGSWYHLSFTYDGTDMKAYLNGNLESSTAAGNPAAASGILQLAYSYLQGSIDEFHVANAARSAEWITTEYNNQSSPSSFYSLGSEEGGFLSSWAYRKAITIDYHQVSADLSNFPVLINLASDANLAAHAQTTGNDILFTSSTDVWDTGSTSVRFAHEIESYNSSSGSLQAWVKIPNLSHTQNTTIYMYYGNGSTGSQQNKTAVWDSNFKSVWHLPNGTTLTANDSTSILVNGTVNAGVTSAAGKIDGAASFNGADGSANNIPLNNISNLNGITTAITLSSWVKPAPGSLSVRRDIVQRCSSHDSWWLNLQNNGLISFYAENITGGTYRQSIGAVLENSWSLIEATYDGSNIRFYLNGSLDRTVSASGTFTFGDIGTIGANGSGNNGTFSGSLDEVRVSDIARTPEWISTEYNNQSAPSTFYSLGSEEGLALSRWRYRKAITIDYTKVSADLTNFPVLINLATDAGLAAHAQITDNDILFTSSGTAWNTGTTSDKLSYEIERYSSSNGSLQAWVKIPNLSHTQNTTVYMYYGNNNIGGQQNATGVWDGNYKGIWHLNQDPSGVSPQMSDSTANANNGASSGMVAGDRIDGMVGKASSFDGVNNFVAVANASNLNSANNLTIEGNIYVNDANNWQSILSKAYSASSDKTLNLSVASGRLDLEIYADNAAYPHFASNNILSAGNWYHFVVAITIGASGNANDVKFYINGVDQTDVSAYMNSTPAYGVGRSLKYSTYGYYFGSCNAYSPLARYFNGVLDELRISNTNRSLTYAATEYKNQSAPGTFYSLSSEQSLATSYTLTAPSPSLGPVNSPSQNFTITPNGIYTGTITITPSGGGLSDPIALTFSDSDAPQTFTITPTTAGTVTLTSANSSTLTDPSPVVYSSVSISANPSGIIQASTNNTINLTGINTSWTSGTPGTPTFTLTGGNGASITSQIIIDPTHATLAIDAGSSTGTLTITDPSIGATASVVVSSSLDAFITSFGLNAPPSTGVIDNTAHTVSLTVPYNTDITNISPTIDVSTNATISPLSGNPQNFTHPVTYTVTAQDGVTTQTYTVTITVAPSNSSSFVPPAKPNIKDIKITLLDNGKLIFDSIPVSITQIAVSTTPDFKNVSWEDIQNKDALIDGYVNSDIYIKFRSKSGAVSDVMAYEGNSNSPSDTNSNAISLIDGDIVKTGNNPDVYIIKYKNNKQYKRLILSPSVFNSYHHLKWENIKIISQSEMDRYTTSNLVKETIDVTIFELFPNCDTGERRKLDNSKSCDIDSVYEINRVDRDSYILVK